MENFKKRPAFIKMNQVWQKAEIIGQKGENYQVSVSGQTVELPKMSPYLEERKSPAQRFAMGDVKERLEGEYISFNKLADNIKDQLSEGREFLYQGTYVNDGELKESVKMVQMQYDREAGSRMSVQYKRNEPLKMEEAVAYNHKFSKDEFDQMVTHKKEILFQGATNDGELFDRLAYYEPKLNNIRTKPALTDRSYIYGTKLNKEQAKSLNQGKEITMTLKGAGGKQQEYKVTYSARNERPITKKVESQKQAQSQQKKKSNSRSIKVGS